MAKKKDAPTAPVSDEKWEIEGWVRTLMDAEKIKTDPDKMKKIQPYLKKEKRAINSLAELRAHAQELED